MISDRPEIQQLQERRAEIDAKEAAHREKAERLRKYREDLERWRAEAQRLALDDVAPPDPPEEPTEVVNERATHEFMLQRQKIDAEERRVLVEIRDEIEEQAAEREQRRMKEVRGLVEQLTVLAEVQSVDLWDVRRCRDAVDRQNPSAQPVRGYGLADRTRSRVEVVDLVEAARTGESLVRVAPVPGRRSEQVKDESAPMTVQHASGKSNLRTFGQPPKMYKPVSNRGRQL